MGAKVLGNNTLGNDRVLRTDRGHRNRRSPGSDEPEHPRANGASASARTGRRDGAPPRLKGEARQWEAFGESSSFNTLKAFAPVTLPACVHVYSHKIQI